jgi:hypothetical protein
MGHGSGRVCILQLKFSFVPGPNFVLKLESRWKKSPSASPSVVQPASLKSTRVIPQKQLELKPPNTVGTMNRAVKRTCITVRKVARHPVATRTIRSGALLRKHVIRATTLSLVPDTVNDVVFHHAQLNIQEVIHATQDSVTIGTINGLVALVTVVSKCM